MTETTRRSLDNDPILHASPQNAEETPVEIPSNKINTPTSTTRDSHDSSVQASVPQDAPPSDSPLNGQLDQEVLEVICLDSTTFGYRKPTTLIAELKAKGKDAFKEYLALPMEGFYLLPFRGEPVSKDRIKCLQQECGLIECPRNEQSTSDSPTSDSPDSRRSTCWPQLYLRTDWPHEFYEHALVFTAQGFGRVGHMPPANMSRDELPNHLTLLMSLWQGRHMPGEDTDTSKSELDHQIQTLFETHCSLFPDQHS